ncbi:MAG: M48 family metallopeptidase [Azoarcus sp.]|jgi:Zn-dependent protease with chaperone function|nr:M48 family metallopeptidase [Azoarcus sp.]
MQTNAPSLDAWYYDGLSSRRQPVRLRVSDGHLRLDGPDGGRDIPAADVRISEAHGTAPRTLRFAGDDTYCEVGQGTALDALLAALGHRDSIAVRLQNRWRWVFVSLASVGLILAAGYLWGLPWGAKHIAPHVPVAVMRPLSNEALAQLDKYLLKPSALPEARRRKLQDGFRELAAANPALLASYGDGLDLDFRAAPRIGPNAFALPGGQIILLDELVALDIDDAEILAILSHELGHLDKRHSIRMLIQSSVVAAITAAWFGDVSYAVGAISAALLSTGYSRDMEREADDYAAGTLRRRGESPALLASALEKLEAAHLARRAGKGHDQDDDDDDENYLDWFSSHPDTAERTRRLREDRAGR